MVSTWVPRAKIAVVTGAFLSILAVIALQRLTNLHQGGKARILATFTPVRTADLPDVPTFTELGYKQMEAEGWMGLWVTPDVPAAVQTRLREATLKALAQPAMRDKLKDIGFEVGQPLTSEEMTKGLRADYERVGAVLKSIGFKPE